jgi:putative glutamine amidotransferase
MTETRPVIGICTILTDAEWGAWAERAVLLPYDYVRSVHRAGGVTVLIPPDPEPWDGSEAVLDLVDGLILAGGSDIDPSCYGAEPHPRTQHTVPERDRFEIALARLAIERDMPVLGICRGMQLLNVAFGGTLKQHLPDEFGHEDHLRSPGSFDDADHDVRLKPGSLAARAAGEEVHVTKSHHHQGVDRIGEGFEVTGHSALDDLAETIELRDRRFVLGVQWHPEADEQSRVISALVEEARAYRSNRGSAYPARRTASVTSSACA